MARKIRTRSIRAECAHLSVVALIISSADLADAFVARCEEDDRDQGQDEGEGTGDSPLTEDNAEVFRGPCK